jgi:hypothetical protein
VLTIGKEEQEKKEGLQRKEGIYAIELLKNMDWRKKNDIFNDFGTFRTLWCGYFFSSEIGAFDFEEEEVGGKDR